MRSATVTEQRVAGRVAERVVDDLEAVEVDEQHRDLGAAPRQRVGEPIDEAGRGWAGR